jgi:hypothetical protein
VLLVLRRVRVVAEAIAVADAAVGFVDDDLDLFALCLLAGLLERFLLRLGGVADALRSGTLLAQLWWCPRLAVNAGV